MARAQYSDEVRLACLTALLAGQSVAEVAAEYKVPQMTLRSWKSRAAIGSGGSNAPLVAQTDRLRIGDLLLAYLAKLLETAVKQLEVMGDVEWLRKQSAAELAVLHGTGIDKAIRIFSALEAGGDDPDEGPETIEGAARVIAGAVSEPAGAGV